MPGAARPQRDESGEEHADVVTHRGRRVEGWQQEHREVPKHELTQDDREQKCALWVEAVHSPLL